MSAREPAATGDAGLQRLLGAPALALTAINLCVGAGIVGLPSAIAAELGGYAFAAYLVCGAVIALALLCFAEAGSRIATAGGPYTYARDAFGPFIGGMTGIVFFLAQGCISNAAIMVLLLETLGNSIPALQNRAVLLVTIVVSYAALATLHIRWAKGGVGAAVGLTVAKLLPLVLVGAAILWAGLPEGLAAGPAPGATKMGHAAILLMFAFMGIEGALCTGSEIRNPARTVPRAVIAAVTVIAILYFAIHLSAERALGPELATAGGNALPLAARTLYGPWAEVVVGVGIVVSMAAIVIGDIFSLPRVPFALGRDGVLPRVLGRVHPVYHTPHVAIAVYSALACLLALSGTFRQLAIAGVSGTLFVYLMTCFSVLRLRRLGVAQAGTPFVIPGGPLVPLAASALILFLLSTLAATELLALGVLLGLAVLVSWWTQVHQPSRPVPVPPGA